MQAGTDPTIYSAYCYLVYEELTRRSRRICWWFLYSPSPSWCRQSWDGRWDGRWDWRSRSFPVPSSDQCAWPLYSEFSIPYRSYHADPQTALEDLLIFVLTTQSLRGNLLRLPCAFHTHIFRRVGWQMINCFRAAMILLGRVKKKGCALLSKCIPDQLIIFSFHMKMFMWVFLNTLSLQNSSQSWIWLLGSTGSLAQNSVIMSASHQA